MSAMPPLVSPAIASEYERLTAWAVWDSVPRHPQWEDILARAHLEVWQRLAATPAARRERQHALVPTIAKQAVCHFLRSPENEHRTRSQRGKPLPLRPSWEAMLDSQLATFRVRVPDFAPWLVERLWRRWVWEHVWERAAEEDRQILWLYFREGRTHREIARVMGCSRVWSGVRLARLLAAYREWLVSETAE